MKMTRVVTKIEWVRHIDLKAKKQSMQWKHSGSLPPSTFKRVSSASVYFGHMSSFFIYFLLSYLFIEKREDV